jgi:hypothetical protein
MAKPRPNALQWLRYSLGGGLPDRFHGWVFADVTGRTWVLRQMLRTLLQLAPFIAVILIFLPGPFWIRGVAVIGGTLMSLFFSAGFMVGTTEHRAVKAGYAPGTAERVRLQRSEAHYAQALAARRAKQAARRAKWVARQQAGVGRPPTDR